VSKNIGDCMRLYGLSIDTGTTHTPLVILQYL
jgi:hypothetical protein